MKTARGHDYAEAFLLMKYASKDGKTIEWIWNSRDGVTPFCVPRREPGAHSLDDDSLSHVDWHLDRYLPDHKPKPGDRIFVTLTVERAREYAAKSIEEHWNDPQYPMSKSFESKEEGVVALAANYLEQPVDLVEVEPERPT